MGFGQGGARGRARTRPGIGLGEKPAMCVGVGRQPWDRVLDSAKSKRFRVSQLVLRRGDEGDKEVAHEDLPRAGPTLV